MKKQATTLLWTALLLIALGLAHSGWRNQVHEVPILPGSQKVYWDIEARVEFRGQGQATLVRLALPTDQPGFKQTAEHTASPGYGVNFIEEEPRLLKWTRREAEGTQWLYYRTQFEQLAKTGQQTQGTAPEIRQQTWEGPLETAAASLLQQAWQESADAFSLASALTQRLSNSTNENAALLLSDLNASEALVRLLNEAAVPARILYGLRLEDVRRNQALEPLVQVFEGETWQIYNPAHPQSSSKQAYLLWQQTAGPVLEVEGGRDSRVRFSMLASEEPASGSINSLAVGDALMNLSIHSLPISEQAVFRTLMLLPLGALIVVLMRVFIGLKTSGTFMPVLIALAFLEMSLATGLITFLIIVGAGLVLRQLLAYLNLLLVARVAAVIVCVIGLIAMLSVVSFHAGISQGMQVTLFPMIILAWTIERMSILWEEEGAREVALQGAGSLLTAIAAFLVMDHPWVRYWLFNFPGLQLVVMAFILLAGSYTGYRLLELVRFKPLVSKVAGDNESTRS